MQKGQFVSASFQDVLVVNIRLLRVLEIVVEIVVVVLQYAAGVRASLRWFIGFVVVVVVLDHRWSIILVQVGNPRCVGLGGRERFACTGVRVGDCVTLVFRLSHLLQEF